MSFTHNLDSINALFFSDSVQRQYYLQKAAEFHKLVSHKLPNKLDKILALHRSWWSEYLIEQGYNVILPAQMAAGEQYDLIIAVDELLTRDIDEASQKKHIIQIINLLAPGGTLVATLRDFRNTNCHRRPIGDACYNTVNGNTVVTTEINDIGTRDKQSWVQKVYVVTNDSDFVCIDAGPRRTLYFKQLAKYCADSGITDFGILKDVYWKSNMRRTPEHVAFARAK